MATQRVDKYTFRWTSNHMPKEQANELKHEYDKLGSRTVTILHSFLTNPNEDQKIFGMHKIDLYGLLQEHRFKDATLSQFWEQTHAVPDWVDWGQIKRGQKFFYRYALGNIVGFALQGFMRENTAAPGVAEVLLRTGGFSTRNLLRRLLETFQFLLQVTESVDAVRPGGPGHTTIIRVRLLHSMVRERIMSLDNKQKGYFDMDELGVPINDIGSIHSITTFCCNHSWLQLPYMGVHPSQQETADYIALFRYVAHVIGAPTEWFINATMAKATMESMLVNEFRLNNASLIIAHNFIQTVVDLPPLNISEEFIQAGSRVINGNEFCDKIHLGRPGIHAFACFKGFCWLARDLALIQQSNTFMDELCINFFKRTMHKAIIDSSSGLSEGSKFRLKHVPRIGKYVGKESLHRPKSTWSGAIRPIETFFFVIFVIHISVALGVGCLVKLVLF